MNTIKEGVRVKYTGEKNDWTFKTDLSTNSIGIVKNVFENFGKSTCQVEFDNGITTSIDFEDLEQLK